MSESELLASQWRILKEGEQELIDEVEKHKRKLNSLMEELATKKELLQRNIPELREAVETHKDAISSRCRFLERRRLAGTHRGEKKEFARMLRNQKKQLVRLQNSNAPEEILERSKRMIFEIEAPINELEVLYHWMEVEDRKRQQAAQQILDDKLDRIGAIEEHYRQTKQYLQEAVCESEQRRKQFRSERVQWAAKTRTHLEWILKNEPLYKEDAVCQYRENFPADNLSNLFPPTSAPVQATYRVGDKKRHAQPSFCPSPVAEAVPVARMQAWKFWVTFNPDEVGRELPQEKHKFLSILQSVLAREDYHDIKPGIVYDKLRAVSKMTLQQRQKIKTIRDSEPLGWKILKVGRGHRLFLLIDEEGRHIRFIPRQRKKSYLRR